MAHRHGVIAAALRSAILPPSLAIVVFAMVDYCFGWSLLGSLASEYDCSMVLQMDSHSDPVTSSYRKLIGTKRPITPLCLKTERTRHVQCASNCARAQS